MTDKTVYLVSFDSINDTQRAQIQALIKARASSWWHQQSNVWIVKGGPNASEWRNELSMFVKGEGVPGNVIVLKLPAVGSRAWASVGLDLTWLKSNLNNESETKAIGA